jgi:hypothetical protein
MYPDPGLPDARIIDSWDIASVATTNRSDDCSLTEVPLQSRLFCFSHSIAFSPPPPPPSCGAHTHTRARACVLSPLKTGAFILYI